MKSTAQSGPVAQLGARFHGMEEVDGSNPSRSTKTARLQALPQQPKYIRLYTPGMPNRTEPKSLKQWISYIVMAAIAMWLILWMLKLSGINVL